MTSPLGSDIGDVGYPSNYSRVLEIDFLKAVATDNTGTATIVGAAYLECSKWPKGTRTVKFKAILESTSVDNLYVAVADLFDTSNALAQPFPSQVAGSQITNSAAPSRLVASKIEADLSAVFPSASTVAGVFEARLRILTNPAAAPEFVTCKSAQLVIEW